MIAILMLLSRGGAGAIVRWSIGGKLFSRVKEEGDSREVIGAGQERMEWVEVQLPSPSHHVPCYLTLTEGGGT